jgi:hypothetical protein
MWDEVNRLKAHFVQNKSLPQIVLQLLDIF